VLRTYLVREQCRATDSTDGYYYYYYYYYYCQIWGSGMESGQLLILRGDWLFEKSRFVVAWESAIIDEHT